VDRFRIIGCVNPVLLKRNRLETSHGKVRISTITPSSVSAAMNFYKNPRQFLRQGHGDHAGLTGRNGQLVVDKIELHLDCALLVRQSPKWSMPRAVM